MYGSSPQWRRVRRHPGLVGASCVACGRAPSALFPDVVFRRLVDEIEISWTAREPSYAPDAFRFALMPGVATLSASAVAGPLWEALNWIGATASGLCLADDDRLSIVKLERRLQVLKKLPASTLEAGYLPERLFSALSEMRGNIHLPDRSKKLKNVPALEALDDAVLMFGGVSPDIGKSDMNTLLGLLSSKAGGQESPRLRALVDDAVGAPALLPFQEGYDLAEQLLEDCFLPGNDSYVDVRALLSGWGVRIVEKVLKTNTIRAAWRSPGSVIPPQFLSTRPATTMRARRASASRWLTNSSTSCTIEAPRGGCRSSAVHGRRRV